MVLTLLRALAVRRPVDWAAVAPSRIERMLELFFAKPTRYLFKIDPDTVIHRRFEYLPVRSGISLCSNL